MTARDEKAALREVMGARRLAHVSSADESAGARAAVAHLPEALHPLVASGTVPFRGELDPRPVLEHLRQRGAAIALPRVVRRGLPLTFHSWTPSTRFETSRFGVDEPVATTPEVTPELLLVPLLAFDRTGARLGYGGGFYDLTLASLRAKGRVVAVGFAWSIQEVPRVPTEPHDQRLDAVLTEREWIAIGSG